LNANSLDGYIATLNLAELGFALSSRRLKWVYEWRVRLCPVESATFNRGKASSMRWLWLLLCLLGRCVPVPCPRPGPRPWAPAPRLCLTMGLQGQGLVPQSPRHLLSASLQSITQRTLPLLAYVGSSAFPSPSEASISDDKLTVGALGEEAYTKLGELSICKVVNGMWQVSGAHGFSPDRDNAIEAMTKCAENGFTTFDAADIYGPAENYIGDFRYGPKSSPLAKSCQFFTKWVPISRAISREETGEAIAKSLKRMRCERLDLLQLHWWDYSDPHYLSALDHLMHLQDLGQILHLGLTNFDTFHLLKVLDEEVPLVSNQVSYSVLDTRPSELMAQECEKRGVKLLCYGALLGGFISPRWLGQSAPDPADVRLTNVSLRKYLSWIYAWGSWDLFQDLLRLLDSIGNKHRVSLSHVAVRYVLQQRAVGAVTLGQRWGFLDHTMDNRRIFSFTLDEDDLGQIADLQSKAKQKGRALFSALGDCGGEYRTRRR
jgi:aryl-alcohol dehydrogenase-like predicted oxidoreductase